MFEIAGDTFTPLILTSSSSRWEQSMLFEKLESQRDSSKPDAKYS